MCTCTRLTLSDARMHTPPPHVQTTLRFGQLIGVDGLVEAGGLEPEQTFTIGTLCVGGLKLNQASARSPTLTIHPYPSTTLTAAAIVLNTTSRGWAHIQSADPLYEPLVTAKTLNTAVDRGNWWYLMRVGSPHVQPMQAGGRMGAGDR